jgi:hypothetical protein
VALGLQPGAPAQGPAAADDVQGVGHDDSSTHDDVEVPPRQQLHQRHHCDQLGDHFGHIDHGGGHDHDRRAGAPERPVRH